MALSSDGNTALISGIDSNSVGAAWVFTRAGSVWTQQAALTASDATSPSFGSGDPVALSSDGNTALIGDSGARTASVFTRAGSAWSQQATLTASDATSGGIGVSVTLSSDGNTALIGGTLQPPGSNVRVDAVWAFTRAGSVWTQSEGANLTSSDYPLAVSSDATTVLTPDPGAGGVEVYAHVAPGGGGGGGAGGGGSGGGGSGAPSPTSRPIVSGTAKAGRTLSCSTGSWSGPPTSFAYQWYRDGTPIQGARSSTYKVQRSDEGLSITCSVIASNDSGMSDVSPSASVAVAVPKVKRCPAATGALRAATLGKVHLGMTRAAARHAFAKSSDRGKKYEDFFCLTPTGVRVGYATKKESTKLAGHVIWASTSSAFYALHNIRVGATVAVARAALKLSAPIKVGRNTWYFAPNGKSNAIFKVRAGIIDEIGIAQKSLTGTRKAEKSFLKSFS